MNDLHARLERIAQAPRLLVASDFDGTLAPLAPRPALARIEDPALAALRALAALPHTRVAVISGRSRVDLAALADWPPSVRLVGSHGIELGADAEPRFSAEQTGLRQRLITTFRAIAMTDPGFVLEEKPAGVALHYRLVGDPQVRAALDTIDAGPARWEGVFRRTGHRVVELFVLEGNKGAALAALRAEFDATSVLFIGDDLTDEDGFALLTDADVGIKVGPGDTRASFRVDSPATVAQLLRNLADRRKTERSPHAGRTPRED